MKISVIIGDETEKRVEKYDMKMRDSIRSFGMKFVVVW